MNGAGRSCAHPGSDEFPCFGTFAAREHRITQHPSRERPRACGEVKASGDASRCALGACSGRCGAASRIRTPSSHQARLQGARCTPGSSGDDQPAWTARCGPAHYHPVEAVDDRRQAHLACRDLELRDVREPLLVRCPGLEVSVDDVLGRGADLAKVGRIPASLGLGHDQALLLHQALHHLLGDGDVLPGQRVARRWTWNSATWPRVFVRD